MQVIRDILQACGSKSVQDIAIGDHIEVDPDGNGLMPLTIEKIGENRVLVAHYYKQHGDLIADPEIIFHIDNGEWTPIRYAQHPHLHHHNENGLSEVKNYVKKWNKNLRHQGYVEAAKEKEAMQP